MGGYGMALSLCEAFGIEIQDALKVIQEFHDSNGDLSTFAMHDEFGWEPSKCVQIHDHLAERM